MFQSGKGSRKSAGRGNLQSQILKRGIRKKNECLGDLKESLPQVSVWGAYYANYANQKVMKTFDVTEYQAKKLKRYIVKKGTSTALKLLRKNPFKRCY